MPAGRTSLRTQMRSCILRAMELRAQRLHRNNLSRSAIVFAPHQDDEVLGCSSVLDSNTLVVYLGINKFHVVSAQDRKKEVKAVAEYFGFNYFIEDLPVDEYGPKQTLDAIQAFININAPEELYLPYSSYNQDHATTYYAGFTTARQHDKNVFVKKILVYEQVHNFLWDMGDFKPVYFRPLSITKKIEAYKLHASQVRSHRSAEMITTLARVRGWQSGQDFAEGFEILRWVD